MYVLSHDFLLPCIIVLVIKLEEVGGASTGHFQHVRVIIDKIQLIKFWHTIFPTKPFDWPTAVTLATAQDTSGNAQMGSFDYN